MAQAARMCPLRLSSAQSMKVVRPCKPMVTCRNLNKFQQLRVTQFSQPIRPIPANFGKKSRLFETSHNKPQVFCNATLESVIENASTSMSSWLATYGMQTEHFLEWLCQKALLFAVVWIITSSMRAWLDWISEKMSSALFGSNENPSDDDEKRKFVRDLFQAAEHPINTALVAGAALSVMLPAPLELGMHLNKLIGRHHMGCLIEEIKLAPIICAACGIYFVLSLKQVVTEKFLSEIDNSGGSAYEIAKVRTIDQVLTVAILGLGAFGIGEILHVHFKALLALGGISGFAFAWGSQQLLGNVFAGIVIRLVQAYSPDEQVIVAGHTGFVKKIGLFVTSMVGTNQMFISIPNSQILGTSIVNISRAKYLPCKIVFGVSQEHFMKVKSITSDIRKMMNSHPAVIKIEKGPGAPRANLQDISPGTAALVVDVNCLLKNRGRPEVFGEERADLFFKIGDIVKVHGAEFIAIESD